MCPSGRLYTCILAFILVSCQQFKKQMEPANATTNKQYSNLEQKDETDSTFKNDSLLLLKSLGQILQMLSPKTNRAKFDSSYEEEIGHSFVSSVSIQMGPLFSGNTKHILIRQSAPWGIIINLYQVNNGQFSLLISHEQRGMTYTNDSINDINGDGFKDFVVHWYGESGCCLKAFSEVYLSTNSYNSFSGSFRFINPTFSPKEQLIRGVCYGHPGETEIYKYKWNGEQVDTIAYISFEKTKAGKKTGRFIESSSLDWDDSLHKKHRILKKIPDEYTKIEGYDWFLGNSLKKE